MENPTSSTSQTNKNTCIGVMNIHERGYPPKRSKRNPDPRSVGSVHDPERKSRLYARTQSMVQLLTRMCQNCGWLTTSTE